MHAGTGPRSFSALRRFITCVAACAAMGFALAARPARAATLSFNTVSEGTIVDDGGNGSFDTVEGGGGGSLSVRQFPGLVAERIGLEYNVSSIPDTAVVTGARFTFQTVSLTSNTGRVVDVVGYSGNGTVTTADATAVGAALGSYNSFTAGLGAQTVDLNPAAIQALLAGDFVGLRLQAGADTVNTQIGSSQFPDAFQPPRLVIDYNVVPEPAGAGIILCGAGLFLARRARHSGPRQLP